MMTKDNDRVEFDTIEAGDAAPAKVPARRRASAVAAPAAPMSEAAQVLAMIASAVANPAIDVDKMRELFKLREEVAQAEAKRAFNAAVAIAKGQIGPIMKDKAVDFTTAKGRTNYRYEGFDTVAKQVDPILNEVGLSYRFRSKQDAGRVTVTCILSHRDGYSEETELSASEDHSGNKNPIQAIGSSATYLQRYTLKLALGLATTLDDDGAAAGRKADPGRIDAAQVERLQARIIDVGADPVAFLDYCGVARLDELPAKDFSKAMMALDHKARQNQKESQN